MFSDLLSACEQVAAYEVELSKLKSEKAKIQEAQARQEDQCRKLHDKVEALGERNRGLKLDNEVKQRQVSSLSLQLVASVMSVLLLACPRLLMLVGCCIVTRCSRHCALYSDRCSVCHMFSTAPKCHMFSTAPKLYHGCAKGASLYITLIHVSHVVLIENFVRNHKPKCLKFHEFGSSDLFIGSQGNPNLVARELAISEYSVDETESLLFY